MKLHELITHLQALCVETKNGDGDVPVVIKHRNTGYYPHAQDFAFDGVEAIIYNREFGDA